MVAKIPTAPMPFPPPRRRHASFLLLATLAGLHPLLAGPSAPATLASAAQLEVPPAAPPAPRPASGDFVPVAVNFAGLLSEGVSTFHTAEEYPAPAALLAQPIPQGVLPEGVGLRPSFSSNGTHFRASLPVPAGSDLYGGGEVTGPLRRNGTTIRLWNTDNWNYQKDGGARLYQSHPWILGLRPDGRAFGVLFDSSWKAELSCGDSITFTAEGPAFPVVVIEKDSPQAVLAALAELTGRMELPPLWALGYQQCRWSYAPASKVLAIAREFRARRLPCDVLWMDIDYMDGFRVFTFDKTGFPDPAALNEALHRLDFHSVWMIDPGIKVDPAYPVYAEGLRQDLFVRDAAGAVYEGAVWPGPCVFPDFTRAAVRQWWAGLYRDFIATGVDGVWNDMNEPAVFKGPDGTMPEDNRHAGDSELPAGPHLQYHNLYGMLMARATREGILKARPDRRPFVLTRANFLGGQRYAATWTGDNASTERDMHLSVPMSLTLGLSGQPFNGPDLGGFAENASPELWADWIGFGTLFPFARGHACKGTNDKEPWSFGEAVESTARLALERRYRLLPYLYTLFREASLTGLPVMRPVFLADPRDPRLRGEQQAFLLGGDLLVVPAWAESPALPAPAWPRLSLVPGDDRDPRQAALHLRPGSLLPLGRIVQHTGEERLEPLTLLACPDASGAAEGLLYEDEGDGFAYQHGNYRLTRFRLESADGKPRLRVLSMEGSLYRPLPLVEVRLLLPDGSQKTLAERELRQDS